MIAEPGKGILRIETIPPGARVYIDGEEQQSRSTMQVLIVLGIHDIRVVLEGYREESAKVNLREKNKILTVPLLLSEHPSPDKPQLTYPANNSRDIATGSITLKWESKEINLTYRVEFDGKTYTTKNKSYTVSASDRGKTYSWRVTATNEWGKETVSDTYSFTTKVNSAPNITLVSPVNASTGILANSITLKWTGKDSDGDEISYRVYFGETSSPTYITTTKESEYKVSNKDWGKKYYWRVEASDNYGGVTTSQVNSFTTQENRAPNAPSVPSPYNYATNQPTTITLSWTCSDPDGDTLTYDVYFGTSSNPTTKISTNQSGRTLNRSNLSYGTTYYWKVVAKDSKGATTEGPEWRFTTQSNRAPNTPSNPSPSNSATNQPLTITLSWDCSDPDGDILTYDVYFGTSSNPTTKVSSGQSGRTLNRSNLSYGTTYYWKVVAKDSKGGTTEGPEWKFTTLAVPEMVLVERGSFIMGDTWGVGNDYEKPTHKVTFTYDFHIGKYETTFDEYDAFCNATGRIKPYNEGWGRGTRPVINVSWNDAIAYCNWLSEKEKLPKAYDDKGNFLDKDGRVTTDPSKVVGYRLPTEAEWEYAARGGNKSKGYKYAGSEDVDDIAWYWQNSGSKTQEVGKKAPNELGIYDMSGNVWEWCSDWYDSGYYAKSPTTNPHNSTAGSYRVNRGGSWVNNALGTRVSDRGGGSSSRIGYYLGFRICRTAPNEGENSSPNILSSPNPANNATDQPVALTLSWDCGDPDGDSLTYDVYFGTDSNPKPESTNQSGKTLSIGNLSAGTMYYWKVVAKDSKGATTEGPVWRFTTQSAPTASSYTPSSIVPQMVLVEKGSFTMGDTWGDGFSDEKPTHKVTFTYDFYIGKYEVTFDEYDAFCNATGRSEPYDWGWGRGTGPVINVSWNDAIAYCNWLSEKEKLPKAYDNNGNFLDKDGRVTTDPSKVVGYRLPTEAEWEYAARGGNKSKGYKYAGSDNVNDVAWYDSNSGNKTQEVGKKAPNELGIYDMSGNVWEWCSDWYGSYSSSAQTNPYNNSGSGRVRRGGSWDNYATYTRVADRFNYSPTYTSRSLGFRIARTVP